MLKRKILSIMLAAAMVLSVFPMSAFAAEVPVTGSESNEAVDNSVVDFQNQDSEWKSVETQDVEIFVTDGYNPISDAEVTFDGERKVTGEDGRVVFLDVASDDTPYSTSVSASGFGNKESEILVASEIEKGTEPVVDFVFSFWTPDAKSSAMRYSARSRTLTGSWVKSEEFLEMDENRGFGGKKAASIGNRLYFPTNSSSKLRGKCLAIYDIADDAWYKSTEIPDDFKCYPSSVCSTYQNFVICETDVLGQAFMLYDTVNHIWSLGQSRGTKAQYYRAKAEVLGSYLYYSGYNYQKKMYGMSIYDIQANSWISESFYPMTQYDEVWFYNNCGFFSDGENFYSLWGPSLNYQPDNKIFTNGYAKLLLKYNIATGQWSEIENWYESYQSLDLDGPVVRDNVEVPEGVYGSRILYDGKIYFIGGTEYFQTCFDVCYYDLKTGEWQICVPLPERLSSASVVLVDSKIYVTGGKTGTMFSGVRDNLKTFVYDLDTNTWATDDTRLNFGERDEPTVMMESGNRLILWGSSRTIMNRFLEIRPLGNAVQSIASIENLTVPLNTSVTELQNELTSEHAEIAVEFTDSSPATLPVSWNVAARSDYDATQHGTYTVYGDVDYSTVPDVIKMPRSNAKVQVTVQAAVESIDEITATLAQGYSYEEVAARLAELHPTVTAHLSDGTTETLPVTWDVNGLGINEDGEQNVYGTLDLTEHVDISAVNCPIKMSITFLPRVMPVDPLEPFSVEYRTSAEEVQAKLDSDSSSINISISNGGSRTLPIVWDVAGSGYNGEVSGDYTIYGDITINESECLNPNDEKASVVVTVKPRDPNEITSIDPVEIEVPQYVMLGSTDKTHAIGGMPTVVELPETVTLHLYGGSTLNVPVNWEITGFDSQTIGNQTFSGTIVLEDDSPIIVPEGLNPPSLAVTVTAAQYDVLEASMNDVSVEVLPGTTLAEVCEQLKEEGKGELHVDAFNSSTSDEVYNYCDLTLEEGSNPEWASNMDIPGEYELKVSMPEDFTAIDDSILDDSAAKVKVTVLQPLEITEVKPAYMDAYQSVEPENLENIPDQVTAVLSNGMEIPIDVEWQWKGSGYQKDLVGAQPPVAGNLVNLPSKAKQPEAGDKHGTLGVNVIAVDYEVTDMQYEDIFESQALLSLEEITELKEPAVTLTISSVTEGIELTTTYEAKIALETEKNPDFDRKYADTYVIDSTIQVPSNITVPTDALLSEVGLQTVPVNVKEIEPIHIIIGEGTEFGDIEKPETVVVTFDVKGPDGEYKKESVEVDWGTGEGYTPNPEGLTEETPVDMTVNGTLTGDSSDYANISGVSVPLVITVIRAYEITAITPNRFPESGAMEVNLGATLEDIYNLLDTHTVELTLKSTSGSTTTREVTFQLKDEDNLSYDPMTEGTYTLKASLSLSTGVSNPNNLPVEIVVKPTKYRITSVKGARIGGVVSGTAFEDVPLPSEVTVNRNDGKTDQVGVTWNGANYNPTKIGSQVVRGTLNTPLPVHLENPNNRQPSAIVTIVNPEATIVSLEEVTAQPARMRRAAPVEDTSVPGYTEYRYMATIRYKDGTVSRELISTYVETEVLS